MVVSKEISLAKLKETNQLFQEVFMHGSLSVEVYKPLKVDLQKPHARDEVYVVISGSGKFFCAGECSSFGQGDLLFVPAGVEHRFEDFTDDFSTWVIFYGPDGGEASRKP
jgi:mannose-6-phosphate isomerase-like protein (cupin superfamily)